MNIDELADKLWFAEQNRQQIDALTKDMSDLAPKEAYDIQLKNVTRRLARGEKVVGVKIGLTSKGMQQLLGVNEPDYGHLFDSMLLLEGEPCDCGKLLQPKVEGELAFCLGGDLRGPGVTVADVYNATSWVAPAIEIVDSRIKDWKIRLEDTIADNGSSARFVLGAGMTPIGAVNMRLTGMTLEKNGVLARSGAVAEVLGNPAASVAWLVNKLAQFDIGLRAGHIILSGAVTAALPAQPGDHFLVSFQGMGSVGIRFV